MMQVVRNLMDDVQANACDGGGNGQATVSMPTVPMTYPWDADELRRRNKGKRQVRFVDEAPDGSAEVVALFPTDQARRDKERKKAGVVGKRRPQKVEQVFQDCG